MAEAKTMEELLTQVGDSVKKVALGDTVTGKVLSVTQRSIFCERRGSWSGSDSFGD